MALFELCPKKKNKKKKDTEDFKTCLSQVKMICVINGVQKYTMFLRSHNPEGFRKPFTLLIVLVTANLADQNLSKCYARLLQARQENRVTSDPGVQTLLNEISNIRKGLTGVQHYDTISVPLVYTQVVTLAVYTYFGAALMGSQWVAPEREQDYVTLTKIPSFFAPPTGNGNNFTGNGSDFTGSEEETYTPLDLYVPLFLMLQFVFYVGWLKVAETLINPFGEDDDDFEINYLIDRHVQV